MPLQALKKIRSKQKEYKIGDILPEMNMLEASRLIDLGAAKEVKFVEESAKIEPSKTPEIKEEPILNDPKKTETDNNPSEKILETVDYRKQSYLALRKLIKERELKPDNLEMDTLIEVLEKNDQEYNDVIKQLQAKSIKIPEYADLEELLELLESSEDDT